MRQKEGFLCKKKSEIIVRRLNIGCGVKKLGGYAAFRRLVDFGIAADFFE